MSKIISFLSGKKTYLVGLIGLAYGLVSGDNQIILDSILAMTIRAGIAKQ